MTARPAQPSPLVQLPPSVLAAFAKVLQECDEARQATKNARQAAKEERRCNEANERLCKNP